MCDSLHFTVTTRPLGFPGDNLNWSLMLILKWKCTEAEGWKTTTMFYFRDLRFSLTHPHPTLWFLLSSSERRRHKFWLWMRSFDENIIIPQQKVKVLLCEMQLQGLSWMSTRSPAVRWRWQTACMPPPPSVLCSAWWWVVTLLTQHQNPSWAASGE